MTTDAVPELLPGVLAAGAPRPARRSPRSNPRADPGTRLPAPDRPGVAGLGERHESSHRDVSARHLRLAPRGSARTHADPHPRRERPPPAAPRRASAVILLVTPLLLILVLGLALGEGFGEKPDERLRISVVNLDRGLPTKQAVPREAVVRGRHRRPHRDAGHPPRDHPDPRGGRDGSIARGSRAGGAHLRAGLQRAHEPLLVPHAGRPAADQPARPRRRPARATSASRSSIDKTQPVSAAVIEQVTQVTLLRVVIPWMIGRAFERVGDDAFMDDGGRAS